MHVPAGTVGPVMQIINGQSCHHIQTDYLISDLLCKSFDWFLYDGNLNLKLVNFVGGCFSYYSEVVLSKQNEVLSQVI